MGKLNKDLLLYETKSIDLLDKVFSVLLKLHITAPTLIPPWTKILVDNVFTNILDEDIICGNLTCSPSTLPNSWFMPIKL